MNNIRKHRGASVIEVVLGIALMVSMIGFAIPFFLEQYRDREAAAYADHLKRMVSALHQYQYYKITEESVPSTDDSSWPLELNNLMTDYPNRFWVNCSVTDEDEGNCVRPDYVPWSTDKLTSLAQPDDPIAPFYSHLVITIPMSKLVSDTKEYLRWSVPLMTIPGAKKTDSQDIEITLRQATQSLIYDNLLMRSGENKLTDNWDVGGHAITNASEFSITNTDGTMTSVSEGLVSIHSLSPWDSLKKPSCPEGLTPNATAALGGVEVAYPYTLTGSIKPYISNETSTTWTFGLNAYVINENNNTYQLLSKGEIIVLVQCKQS